MSGLVSVDYNTTSVETVAGSEAYTHWLDGDFVSGDQDWRFFVAHTNLTFLSCRHGTQYEWDGWVNPMNDADEAAAHLQQQYDMLNYH